MTVIVCRSAKEKCYAVMWSYGEICVGCGCCKRGAYKERLKYHQEQLKEAKAFSNWFPEIREIQEANQKENIKYERRMIRELRKKLAKRKRGGK